MISPWTPLFLGIAGSLHCAGMCTPLVMAVTFNRKGFVHKLNYNAGRMVTYIFFGAFATVIGSAFNASKYGAILSLVMGIFLLFVAISGLNISFIPLITPAFSKFTTLLKLQFGRFLKLKNPFSVFLLGMINGLLPCGLTFIALTYCFTLVKISDGILFMGLFGIGTLGMMLGFTSLLVGMIKTFRFNIQRVNVILVFVTAVALIGRGLLHVQSRHVETATTPQEIICK